MADTFIKDPFTEVEDKPYTPATGSVNGLTVLNNLLSLQLGSGASMFGADSSGIWLGAEKFEDAPFKVDMNGNLYFKSANGQMIFDNANNRFLSNDGLTNRILIGGL